MMQLRDYQSEAVEAVFGSFRLGQNPLVVLPTGAGKSLVIAEICRRVVNDYGRRAVVLQHRKELIEQNAAKIPFPVGLYSAGLNRRQVNEAVVLAGIQSVYSKAIEFGRRHLVIIDEAHLVASEGMFNTFLTDLATVNPDLRIVGLTATPFRTGEGSLVGNLWSTIAYEAKIPRLIADGYLCPITNQPSALKYDTSSLHIRGGEFIESELQSLFDDNSKVSAAAEEIKSSTADRKSVIVFCSGVNHAFHVAEQIGGQVIHGGSLPLERSSLIEAFKSGQLKYLVNCDVLTTGFDAPNIDAVVILRATMSAGLFVQMAGRGFRKHPAKSNCLILDFGNNIQRHGPLDAIDFGKVKIATTEGVAPEKACPNCNEAVATGTRVCECGFIFPKPQLNHETEADTSSAVLAKPQRFTVRDWVFSRHDKKEIPSLRVTYQTSGNIGTTIDEWVCLEHDGFAGAKALAWWEEHSNSDLEAWVELLAEIKDSPDKIDAAIACQRDGLARCPSAVIAVKDGRWWRVTAREFEDVEAEEEMPF